MRFIYIIIAILLCMVPIFQNLWRNNLWVDLTYIAIIVVCILGIFNKRNLSFSLYKMFYMFTLFFFGISAYIQYSKGIVFWKKESAFFDNDYILTNCILILIIIIFEITYRVFFKLKIRKSENLGKHEFVYITKTSSILMIGISIMMFILTLYAKDWIILRLFVRGSEFDEIDMVVGPLDQIVSNVGRPFPMILFLAYYSIKKKFDFVAVVLMVIGVLANFPTGLARYGAAALYIPFVLLVFPIVGRKFNFNLLLVAGLLIVFPFLNNFRHYNEDSEFSLDLDFQMFEEGHFDSYSSLLRVVKYDIITYGEQLLGAILFWVPRSVWPSKPIGSGAEMADILNLTFSNISCNFFAEGYINFGIFGVLLFSFLLGLIYAHFDANYVNKATQNPIGNLQYLLFVGFTFFLLRGDLLSSLAYLVGFNVCLLIINLLFLRKRIQ